MALKIMFGSLAADYIRDSGREIGRVAEEIGRTPANQFSKWRNGRWTYIAESKLVRIIDIIAKKDQGKRAALMCAYLIDMSPDPLRHLIAVRPLIDDEKPKVKLGEDWTPSMRERLEDMARAYAQDAMFMEQMDMMGRMAKRINAKAPKGR
jgi:hypothetical protein